MHQQKSKKILIYFFLLFLVGSINNINLNNSSFLKIKDINIIGLENKDTSILLKEIHKLNLENIFFIDKKKINEIITKNTLVEKYEVFKNYPSSLKINIEKTKFLSKINDNGKIFFIGSNGKLTESNFLDYDLPFIFGKPSINEFISFKKIIDQSKFLYGDINNLYFFPSRRWDIELNNNVIIKLPRNYSKESLELVFEFLNNHNFKDIKIIDVRIKNQIILYD